MYKVTLLILLGLVAATPALGQESKNLVLGRPYTYWPEPGYHDCKDDSDATQLTDGKKYPGENNWTRMSTVGWAEGINIPTVFHFDLGQEATLTELGFNTSGGGGAGVVEVGLRVFVSLDDKSYVSAAEHVAPPLPAEGQSTRAGVYIKLPLASVRARYVAVVAMAPPPRYFVFVDEIEIRGEIPADARSSLPVQRAIMTSGARGLQEVLAGGINAAKRLEYLTAPVKQHVKCWPPEQAQAQRRDIADATERAIREANRYDEIRAAITAGHRDRARQVYGAPTLVWEVPPSEKFTMLSLPGTVAPTQRASVHIVINALEATALGAANLTDADLPLKISVTNRDPNGPAVTPRVGRFFVTENAQYIPDALLALDCPQVIPAGESKLVWIGVETPGTKPGVYGYEIALDIGGHAHRIPLTVHVHNVTLSLDTLLSTGNWSDLNTGENALFPYVRDSMLAHRITMGAASAQGFLKKDAEGNVIRPIQIDFTDVDKFMDFHKDFPQISWFYPFN